MDRKPGKIRLTKCGSPVDLDTSGLPFVIDAFGAFTPAQVQVHYEPQPRPTTTALDALIESEWTKQLELAVSYNRILFNGSLLRYTSHAVDREQSLRLTVGPTCYRDFVGTNLYNNGRLGEFGWQRFANPIGITATLTSSDGFICYGRRSPRVSYHAGHVHTFGGMLEDADRTPDGSIDPFGSLCREIREELNIARDELRDLRCVGLIRDKEIHQPELLFEATVEKSADHVRDCWQQAECREEHVELVMIADEPDAIIPFTKACGPIAPVAIAALFLHGAASWGGDWFESARTHWQSAG